MIHVLHCRGILANLISARHPAVDVYSDKQTSTDTDRDGYRKLMEAIEDGDVERIVDENEVALHILDMDIDLDPDDR